MAKLFVTIKLSEDYKLADLGKQGWHLSGINFTSSYDYFLLSKEEDKEESSS